MNNKKTWIWEHENYPHFIYDRDEIDKIIIETTKTQGVLEGVLRHLTHKENDSIILENAIDEIMTSSKIEGEILQRSSVRSSLKKQIEKIDDKLSSKHTDNLAEIQEDANIHHNPLSIEKLNNWHYNLLIEGDYDKEQVTPGEFRNYDDMYIQTGEGIRTKIHYIALPEEDIAENMSKFLEYCNSSKENIFIKSAIVHIWFEQIHPYGDGNGRIGRNITNYLLSKELGLDTRYFSFSNAILQNDKSYYEALEKTNKLSSNPNLDLSHWIKVHTNFINSAINTTIKHIDKIIKKTKFYDHIEEIKINNNQSKAINMLLEGRSDIITNAIYRVVTNTTQVTASRQLADLVKKGVLKKVLDQEGRSAAYELNIQSSFQS